MEHISQKTFVFFLIVTIILSAGITFWSLSKIRTLLTGMGSTGWVNVSIASTSSVNLIDTQIQFGSCAPTATFGCNVSSNASSAQCSCGGGVWPDNITVQNDGNRFLNVTVKTTDLAATFIGGSNPQFWFSARNATLRPGCYNSTTFSTPEYSGLQWDWMNFSTSNSEYTLCGNLTFTDTNDQLYFFAKLFLPADAPVSRTNNTATLTFTANAMP